MAANTQPRRPLVSTAQRRYEAWYAGQQEAKLKELNKTDVQNLLQNLEDGDYLTIRRTR